MESVRRIAGRYEIRGLIGRGGMAEVFIGTDTRLNRTVAIKMLRQDLARDPIFQARFRREAQSAANLNHPAIVAVYDTGEEAVTASDGAQVMVPYIVMEYVEGRPVKDLLVQGRPVPIDESIEIVCGVLDALEYSHRQGLVHRDIKPGNIMLTNQAKIKVMDFGIARALTDSAATMTQADAVVGTAQYLSPEQARGEQVDARSDLYSTGCLLFELLTGLPPFKGDSAVAVAFQHVSQLPPQPSQITPDIPEALDRVVMKALAKDRNERYSNAAQMRMDLLKAVGGHAVSAPPANSWAQNVAKEGATQVLPATVPTPAAPSWPGGPIRAGGAPTGVMPPAPAIDTKTDDPEKNKSKGIKIVFSIIGVLIAILIAVGAYLMFFNAQSPEKESTVVPVMTSKDQDQVRTILREAGLQMTFGQAVESETVPEGLFVKSEPAENTKVDKGSSVKVFFSAGPGETTVPDVKEMTQEQAKNALKTVGLSVGTIDTVDTGAASKGKVISTNPQIGEAIDKGKSVNLIIASGNVLVPSDLVGKNISEVEDFAAKNKLSVTRTEVPTSESSVGTVMELKQAGQLVPQNSTIKVTVAKEAPKPPTPSEAPSPSEDPEGELPAPPANNNG